jgi:hypothetical protein
MSSEPLARPDIAAEVPIDMDYEVVYAAVTATERDRWFLDEYAKRNRDADTDRILAAIARMESAVRGAMAQSLGLLGRDRREIADVVDQAPRSWITDGGTTCATSRLAPSVPSDPLAALRALSEQELIALFG